MSYFTSLAEWCDVNSELFCTEALELYSDLTIEPSTYHLKLNAINAAENLWLVKWIKRRTDTSIYLDHDNCFHSAGFRIFELSNAIVNVATHDIFTDNEGPWKLFGYSHHEPIAYSWILYRNNVFDLSSYIDSNISHLSSKTNLFQSFQEPCLLLNTRWSSTNFFHWFHEAVPRLLYIKQHTNLLEQVKLIWGGTFAPRDFHLWSFKALGIDVDQILFAPYNFRASKLIIPTFIHAGAFHPLQIKLMKMHFQSICNLDPQNFTIDSSKVLIMRKPGCARSFYNHNSFVDLVEKNDYTLLDLEEYPLPTQVNILCNADNIIAPHGAGLTHVVHLKEGTNILELMPEDSIHPLYWYLSELSNLKYNMLPCKIAESQQLNINLRAISALL